MKLMSAEPIEVNNERSKDEDLEWSLKLNWMALRMLGAWPEERHLSKEPLSVKLRLPFVIVATILWAVLPQMYALYMVIDQLPLAIDNFVTNCGSVIACAKYFFLWRNKRELWSVIESVRCDWLRTKSDWERQVMIKHAGRARLFTVGGYWLLAGCYAGFAFAPLFGFNIRIINNITDHGQRHLLFQTYYPFDYWRSPYYKLTELLQLFVGFFVGLSISMPDNYFGALVCHASGQFEILDRKVESCIGNGAALPALEGAFAWSMSGIVKRHVQLIKNVNAIERAFSFVIFAQLLNMSLLLCCIGFQVIGIVSAKDDKPSYLPILTLIGIIGAFMMNTLLDCYASESLATTSSKLFDKIYNSKWYNIPPQSTKIFLPMMMMMSLTPLRLTAGKIFQLSMATYCALLKSAGGYISMLLAVSSR